ncbi:MAG TPA: hypothetical protein PKA06_03915, partial [Gemmatales bacterium]|nr:hypothetical protein [Gemmatales bacterium]
MSASLLIGLDGSNYCSASTQFGIRWAKRYGTSLKGVAVVDEVSICAPGPVPLGGGAAKRTREKNQLSDAHHKADLFLEQFARECQQAGVRFE